MTAPQGVSKDSNFPEYTILMPMRNEMGTLEITLQAIVKQTILPSSLIIIDDGSSDGSEKIAQSYSEKYPWIHHYLIRDRGFDLVGKGVAERLNGAIREFKNFCQTPYLAKVDADLNLPENYFEFLLGKLEANFKLAVCCGHPYTFEQGQKFLERHGDHFPSGTARVYRSHCLKEIGYFVNSVGWDTVDLLKFQMRGYEVRTFHELEFHHIRRMGTRNGYIEGIIRDGNNAYLTGYVPIVFFCRAVFNMKYRPYILRTYFMLYGYFKAYILRKPRVVSYEEMQFHKKIQWQKLNPFSGK